MANQELNQFEQQLARELTPELAAVYVHGLLKTIEVVERGVEWHFDMGEKLYGPLIVGYVRWLESQMAKLGHVGPVYFALRDAAPLMKAAQVMWKDKEYLPIGVYANRPLLGVEDEIAPEKSVVNGDMMAYFAELGVMNAEKVIWSDTGAWGTVIKAMKLTGMVSGKFYPMFWYSHNPHIPGYLNGLLNKAGLPEKFGEVVNDSIECVFPQLWQRPLELEKGSMGWQVKLVPSGNLSCLWGQAALDGVAKAASSRTGVMSEVDAIGQLYLLHIKAKQTGVCTGVLAENTPTWSKGDQFLAEWPKDLLP